MRRPRRYSFGRLTRFQSPYQPMNPTEYSEFVFRLMDQTKVTKRASHSPKLASLLSNIRSAKAA